MVDKVHIYCCTPEMPYSFAVKPHMHFTVNVVAKPDLFAHSVFVVTHRNIS